MERCDPFEAAHAGGADRDHPPSPPPAGRHGLHGFGAHLHPFTVKLQGREVFVFDGAEGAQAHMQGDPGQLDAPIGEGLQQGIAEMEAGRGAATAPGLLA